MPTLAERILALLENEPGPSDREITDRLFSSSAAQQPVNIACRNLAKKGFLIRQQRTDGRIGNYPAASPPTAVLVPSGLPAGVWSSEDGIKRTLDSNLRADGWTTTVAWAKSRGIDIEARRGNEKWVIEAKREGSLPPMRVNYFLAILGALLQRMDDEHAKYSIALPDLPQFRGLWVRLPALAKKRTGISALFIGMDGTVTER